MRCSAAISRLALTIPSRRRAQNGCSILSQVRPRITRLYGWLVAESLRIATEAGEKRNARTRRDLLELALRYRAAARRVAEAERNR